MSGCYSPHVAHYMLPGSVIAKRPPEPGMFVTAAQVFDFIIDPNITIPIFEKHRTVKRAAVMDDIEVSVEWPGASAIMAVFARAFDASRWPNEDFGIAFYSMLMMLQELPNVSTWVLKVRGELAGFQICHEGQRDLFHVFRHVVPEHKDMTRFLDLHAYRWARETGRNVNIGDAYRSPSLTHYKLSQRPVELRPYFNVLARQEMVDNEQPCGMAPG